MHYHTYRRKLRTTLTKVQRRFLIFNHFSYYPHLVVRIFLVQIHSYKAESQIQGLVTHPPYVKHLIP